MRHEILTRDQIYYIAHGIDPSHVFYFNYDNDMMSDTMVLKADSRADLKAKLARFYDAICQNKSFAGKYELAGIVQIIANVNGTRTVNNSTMLFDKYSPIYGGGNNSQVHSRMVLTKLIARDIKTGKLVLDSSKQWLGSGALKFGQNWFESTLDCGAIMPHYQSLLANTAVR